MAETKRMTKSAIFAEIAEKTNLTKRDIVSVFGSLQELIKRELSKKGPGEFVIPDMLKLKVRPIPARKAEKKMVLGVMRDLPARPASRKLGARPMKKLKDLVTK